MRRIIRQLALIICLLALVGVRASATQVKLEWVEVDVSPTKTGKTTFIYKIRYKVLSGPLHGFYFQGFGGAQPYFDYGRSYAFDSNGRKYGLSISPVEDDKYDIVLANEAAIYGGEATYIVLYGADLAAAGQMGYTQSQFGKLVYLNWSPVQWDTPADHMTVYLHYPIQVPGKQVSQAFLKKVGFRTEKFVNINYLISYYGQPYNGKYYLTVRFHKKDPPALYHMRVQCYINAKYFALNKRTSSPQPQPNYPSPSTPSTPSYPSQYPYQSSPVFRTLDMPVRVMAGLAGLLVVGLIAAIVLKIKFGVYSSTINKLDEISWERGDWVPPKIKVSSYRQKGKVADLEPIRCFGAFAACVTELTR